MSLHRLPRWLSSFICYYTCPNHRSVPFLIIIITFTYCIIWETPHFSRRHSYVVLTHTRLRDFISVMIRLKYLIHSSSINCDYSELVELWYPCVNKTERSVYELWSLNLAILTSFDHWNKV